MLLMYVLTNPSKWAGCDTRSIFKEFLTGLNSEFSFSYTGCHTKVKELSLPYYLSIAGGRIIRLIPFLSVLLLCEMQTALSRIWTQVAVSISIDDNDYTADTLLIYLFARLQWQLAQLAGVVKYTDCISAEG